MHARTTTTLAALLAALLCGGCGGSASSGDPGSYGYYDDSGAPVAPQYDTGPIPDYGASAGDSGGSDSCPFGVTTDKQGQTVCAGPPSPDAGSGGGGKPYPDAGSGGGGGKPYPDAGSGGGGKPYPDAGSGGGGGKPYPDAGSKPTFDSGPGPSGPCPPGSDPYKDPKSGKVICLPKK
ncbi:MAG: hypothetical protein KC503_15955 [Myxococcales bacterium]|nr:hypothetical protein [Myxococcales bacterium]